jgi:hypothetical protein
MRGLTRVMTNWHHGRVYDIAGERRFMSCFESMREDFLASLVGWHSHCVIATAVSRAGHGRETSWDKMNVNDDLDPRETGEWLDTLRAVHQLYDKFRRLRILADEFRQDN